MAVTTQSPSGWSVIRLNEDAQIMELIENLDPSDMVGWTRRFPEALRTAITRDIGIETDQDWSGVLFLGVGGSGAGGMMLCNMVDQAGGLPFVSWKDYGLPSWWGPEWLVIATSYSGNTEETLTGVKEALEEGGTVIGISSGGTLQDILENHDGAMWIDVPAGQPPRSAVGHIFGTQVNLCWSLGLLPQMDEEDLNAMLTRMETLRDRLDLIGGDGSMMGIARELHGQRIQIMSAPALGAMGYRCRTQLNENSGILATASILPELHHNEIVAWGDDRMQEDVQILLFVWNGIHDRVGLRVEWTLDTLQDVPIHILDCSGDSLLESILFGAHLSDWLSIACALLRNKDPTGIGPINNLKSHLSNIPMDQ